MKRALLYIFVLALAAAMALPFAPISTAVNVKVRHTVIAATGEASPTGGNYLPGSFSNVRLNARHEVVFDANVGPSFSSDAFVSDGKTISTVALGINPDPVGPSFGSVTNPYITPNGDVLFDANGTDTYKSDGKTIVPIVRDGDPAPGGGTLSPIGRVANNHGVIAYGAFLSGSAGTQGIFRTDDKQTVAIARDDISAPTGGIITIFGNPVINDRGQVAFYSNLSGGSADFAIFRGDDGELKPVFVANQIAPGGASYEDFGNPVINQSGQVAASASLTNSTSSFGLFVGDGSNTVAIALEGQAAPKGGNYARGFFSPLRMNDNGEVAFFAGLTGGASGLFRGNGNYTTPVALSGSNAPGTTGTFNSFRDFQLLNDGRIAVIATLTFGVGGVNTSNNMGIWIGTSDEDLQLVVRTGEVIDGRVLTRLPQFGQGNQFEINENSVVWVGTFGTTKAIVYSRILGESDNVAS
jgi:hypothetical protein